MKQQFLKKWRVLAPLGLVFTGAGLSLVGDAAALKAAGASFWHWFAYGTFSLIVFNTGLVLFAESIKCRIMYELAQDKHIEN